MKPNAPAVHQRGMVLVSSLLLLVVVTLLAVTMFHGFGEDERIAGNIREKHRAVNAAESAEEYAEWWLSQGNGPTPVNCSAVVAYTVGQICNTTSVPANFASLPWLVGGNPAGVTYAPPTMSITGAAGGEGTYYQTPEFYITYLTGLSNGGAMYQIDAVGYGGSPDTAAVIEAVYKIQSNVTCYAGQSC
jgi:type IV pilus assembly protein PilX